MVVYFRPSETLELGIIVSKKVDKRAVKRNLLKRRCREIVRLNRPKKGQYIMILRYRALSMSYEALKQAIEGILVKTVQNEKTDSQRHSALPKSIPTSTSDMSV